jgi:hypothetical protein
MNIEVVEFYVVDTSEDNEILSGTLHVYLIDYDIDLRGIFVSKKKNYWHFTLPYKKAVDGETGAILRYPIFSFANLEKNKDLFTAIRTKGREYIENLLNQTICEPK